ncbi:MAG TPA: ATP-dependent RNA helicase HrpA [Xanthomonadaceae bacterium]|nr:ATP-dependent RNA helicase HrpA [Xanthomonadaceae bacterium]
MNRMDDVDNEPQSGSRPRPGTARDPVAARAPAPDLAALRTRIDLACSRDRGRLLGLLRRWSRAGDPGIRDRLEAALQASTAERAARAASVPSAPVDPQLPIAREAGRLVGLIREHPVVVVSGATGSGKTTQLPKLCLAAGRGAAGMIGCTQPRRLAVRSVARRVAQELGVEPGAAVGWQVRFTAQVSNRTLVKFMTDGILLAEIAGDRWLSAYDTLIVDEAHERSLNIDFLLGYLRTLLQRRPDLKLIVTSATIDTERFARHFDDAPVVDVEGRGYPVEIRYRGEAEERGSEYLFDRAIPSDGGPASKRYSDPLSAIVAALDEITAQDPSGDTLVFLPGEREIREAHRALAARRYRSTGILPLYARLSARDQDRVFEPGPGRRIVLATNVAETSLTVPRIRYVVDTGNARVKRYSPRRKLDRLHVEPISRASADQRAGRCGRVAPGVCLRLYTESDYLSRPHFTDPEIRRSSLAGVILRMLALGLGAIETFPFLEPPEPRAIADGWQQLTELGAVDGERRLTAVGRHMAKLPVDPRLARMLVAAQSEGCLHEMVVITAFLSIPDPRERPAEARAAADAAHARHADPKSEFAGIVRLWQAWEERRDALSQGRLREWCREQFLSYLRMREWRELHRQLKLSCEALGWDTGAGGSDYAALHRALLGALATQIGRRTVRGDYEAPRQRRFRPFPASPLAKAPPPWIMSATLLDTARVYGLTNARIEPDWVIAAVPHLLALRHYDPHWDRRTGRVLAFEETSLFGLVLTARRRVDHGRIDPAHAHRLFVEQALAPGEIDARARFVSRNRATLAGVLEIEHKLRRSGLVADEAWQASFYLERIPARISSARALDAWYRRLEAPERHALEWSPHDLLHAGAGEAGAFPDRFEVGNRALRLRYRFEPGADDDGVTLELPLPLLNALDPVRVGWTVPGLVEEKAVALIRTLPKALRRNFVPAPDFAHAFAQAHPQPESGRSITAALSAFLERTTGVSVPAEAWDEATVPDHLRMRLELLDESGAVVDASRDLDRQLARYGERSHRAFAEAAARSLPQDRLVDFPADGIPERIPGEGGVPAFPALVDHDGAATLQAFADAGAAACAHAQGVERLLRLQLTAAMKRLARQLPISQPLALLYTSVGRVAALREELVEAAFAACRGELSAIRTPTGFAQCRQAIERTLFAGAVANLAQVERIFEELAGLRPLLEPPMMGFATANYADLRAQLERLVHPGFLSRTPPERLSELPRYLQAMRLRAERLRRDPARDQARMLELRPFETALAAARSRGVASAPQWQGLRWRLEEFRVSLFAQELGTAEPVSAKRLARELQALEAAG